MPRDVPELFRDFWLEALREYAARHPARVAAMGRTAAGLVPVPEQLVTLAQAATLCGRSKRTLERLRRRADFPAPVNGWRNGQTNFYRWAELRDVLANAFGQTLPGEFPAIGS